MRRPARSCRRRQPSPAYPPRLTFTRPNRWKWRQPSLLVSTALTVLQRLAVGHEAQASPTFPAFTASVTLLKRIAIITAVTRPAFTAPTVAVQQRIANRKVIEAAAAFPAMSPAVALYQTERVEASKTFAVIQRRGGDTHTVIRANTNRGGWHVPCAHHHRQQWLLGYP